MKLLLFIINFLKDFHLFAFELLYRGAFVENDMLMACMGVFAVFLGLVYDGLTLYLIVQLIKWISIKLRTKKVLKESVRARVLRKKHEDTIFFVNNVPMYGDEYYIIVSYNGKELSFENEKKYNTLNENDEVSLQRIRKIDKNGRMIEERFELE